jgi:uncharacterized protein
MTDDPAPRAVSPLRRKDRHLDDDDWIDRLLAGAPIGHLAIVAGDAPTIHSHNFWSDGDAIYSHGSLRGALAVTLAGGPQRACFTVAEAGRILVADAAADFGTEFASVVAYGTIERIHDEVECARALEGLMRKYVPQLEAGRDYRRTSRADLARTAVYRFDVERRIAKHNIRSAEHRAVPYPVFSFIEEERAADRLTNRPKPTP